MPRESRDAVLLPAAARGVVGAMAMTGFRAVAAGFGLIHKAPPEEIAEEGVPRLLAGVPSEHRDQAIQLAHWGYGAAAGVAFALLPGGLRRHVWAGPAYGLATWIVFEAGLAPLLGLRAAERKLHERATLAADHVLYGFVVAARPRSV